MDATTQPTSDGHTPLRMNWEQDAGRSGQLSGDQMAFFRQMDRVAALINDQKLPVASIGVRNDGNLCIVVYVESGIELSTAQRDAIMDACGSHGVSFEPVLCS